MIWSTYHVFGSGVSGTRTFVRPDMTAAEFIAAIDELLPLVTDDGHNGFMGTESVPDDDAKRLGIFRDYWADPGRTGTKAVAGMVLVKWLTRAIRQAVKEGRGDMLVNDSVSAGMVESV